MNSVPGRFYFWGERALYLGPGLPAAVHAHHAVQVCIALAGTVRLRTGPRARWSAYAGAMIPSNQSHESDVAVPLIATFWVEPTTGEAGRMQELQPTLPIVPLPQSKLGAIVPRLLEGWRERSRGSRLRPAGAARARSATSWPRSSRL